MTEFSLEFAPLKSQTSDPSIYYSPPNRQNSFFLLSPAPPSLEFDSDKFDSDNFFPFDKNFMEDSSPTVYSTRTESSSRSEEENNNNDNDNNELNSFIMESSPFPVKVTIEPIDLTVAAPPLQRVSTLIDCREKELTERSVSSTSITSNTSLQPFFITTPVRRSNRQRTSTQREVEEKEENKENKLPRNKKMKVEISSSVNTSSSSSTPTNHRSSAWPNVDYSDKVEAWETLKESGSLIVLQSLSLTVDHKHRCSWADRTPQDRWFHDNLYARISFYHPPTINSTTKPLTMNDSFICRLVMLFTFAILETGEDFRPLLDRLPAFHDAFNGFNPIFIAAMTKTQLLAVKSNKSLISCTSNKLETIQKNCAAMVKMGVYSFIEMIYGLIRLNAKEQIGEFEHKLRYGGIGATPSSSSAAAAAAAVPTLSPPLSPASSITSTHSTSSNNSVIMNNNPSVSLSEAEDANFSHNRLELNESDGVHGSRSVKLMVKLMRKKGIAKMGEAAMINLMQRIGIMNHHQGDCYCFQECENEYDSIRNSQTITR